MRKTGVSSVSPSLNLPNVVVRAWGEDGASQARRPYRRMRVVRPHAFDLDELAALSADAYKTCRVDGFSDINVARPDPEKLQRLRIDLDSIRTRCASALAETGVIGTGGAAYLAAVTERMDYLTSAGVAFHNDTDGEWPRCLFWILVLDAPECEIVLPHAGERVKLASGDFVVFDPCIPHGLCRPRDDGRVLQASFGDDSRQAFLSGEIRLNAAQWAEIGCPWIAGEPCTTFPATIDLAGCNIDAVTGDIEPGPLRVRT